MIEREWLSMGGSPRPCYVAQALGGLERTAIHHLAREGIEAFSPVASYRDRERQLFPCYVFAWLDEPERQSFVVNRIRGVVRLLPFGRDPRPLPLGFVEELQERLDRGEFSEDAQDELIHKFRRDDVVVPVSGVFRDQSGRFLRYRKGSGVVLGMLFGREVEYDVPLHQLRRAEAA